MGKKKSKTKHRDIGTCSHEEFKAYCHRDKRTEDVYRALLDLIKKDRQVQLSSKCLRPPAHQCLVTWTKFSDSLFVIPSLLLLDISEGQGTWSHILLLHDVFSHEAFQIPVKARGRIKDIENLWLEWGEKKGYFVPKTEHEA